MHDRSVHIHVHIGMYVCVHERVNNVFPNTTYKFQLQSITF